MPRKKDVKKKVDKFIDMFKEIEELNKSTHEEVSNTDKELSSIYHKIEGMDDEAIDKDSEKTLRELQKVLLKRRLAKRDSNLTRSIVDRLEQHMGGAVKKHGEICKKHVDLTEEIKQRAKE